MYHQDKTDDFGFVDRVSVRGSEVVTEGEWGVYVGLVEYCRCANSAVAVRAISVETVSWFSEPKGLAGRGRVLIRCNFDGEGGAPARGEAHGLDGLNVVRFEVVCCYNFMQGAAVAFDKVCGLPDVGGVGGR